MFSIPQCRGSWYVWEVLEGVSVCVIAAVECVSARSHQKTAGPTLTHYLSEFLIQFKAMLQLFCFYSCQQASEYESFCHCKLSK